MDSKTSTAATGASRRDFLKIAAAGAPAAAAVAVAGPAAAEDATPTALGLRKTEHVKKYLESARF